jgi:putative inorganic carbon (HCO3(-)) transporter
VPGDPDVQTHMKEEVPASPVIAISEMQTLRPMGLVRAFVQQPASFWFACGYLFCEYVRPQSIYPWIDIVPWPAVFIGLALLCAVLEGQAHADSSGIGAGLLLMSAIVLMSALAAQQPALSFSKWRMFYDWVIIYFVLRKAVNTETKLFMFIVLFVVVNIKMTQHGFLTWAARGFAFDRWGVSGAPGWFQNSGEFGIQLCVFTPLLTCVALALWKEWGLTARVFVVVVLISALGSAIATSSRGALVGLAAASMWMAMRSRYFVRALVALAIVGSIVYSNIAEESLARFRNMGNDQTSLHRMERWEHGWQAMKDNPLLGVGVKNWEVYYPLHFRPKHAGPMMVHNVFIEAGIELGFLGLGAFLWLIFLVFRTTRRVISMPDQDNFMVGLSRGLEAGTVGLVVSSSFVTVFYYPYFWIQFLLASCLYSAARNGHLAPDGRESGPRREVLEN